VYPRPPRRIEPACARFVHFHTDFKGQRKEQKHEEQKITSGKEYRDWFHQTFIKGAVHIYVYDSGDWIEYAELQFLFQSYR
jgi:hypothetical protein